MEFLRDSVPNIDGRAFWVNGTNKRISLEKKKSTKIMMKIS